MNDNTFFVLVFGLGIAFIWFMWHTCKPSSGEEVEDVQDFSATEQQESVAAGLNQTFGD